MVARDGRERDRDSTEEEVPDYRDPGEPVSPTEIVGAEVPSGPAEPAGSGAAEEAAEGEAARKAAEEEAAGKAAEEEAAKKAAEEAAAKAAEEEAAKKAAEEEAARKAAEEADREEPAEFALEIVPAVGGPYPVAKDSKGVEYTYQEVRRVRKRKKAPKEPKEPIPDPGEGPKKKPKKEEPEKPEEEGKGKKGKGKGRGFRIRSEEAFQKRKLKSLNKRASEYQARGEELPERLQQLLASFGPGGVSSGSRDRPRVETKPAYVPRFVLKEAPRPEAEATSDIPEPDPAVEDQRRVRVGQLTTPKKPEEKKESEAEPAGGVRLRSRSSARLHRESGRQLSNYRRRLSAAQEAVAKAKARGSVRASIRQGVYKKEGLEEACSSCDDRVKKQQEVIREFASRRIAERRAKAAAEERPTKTKERKERKERTKEEQEKNKDLPVIVAGEQRGESLEREVIAQTYEYLRTRKRSEAAPRAEGERKEKKEEEKRKREEEKKKKEEEEKEKERKEEKKEERKPWILKAVEKAEAAERAEAAAKAEEYSYYSEVPEEEETEEEEKEEDPISEIGTPHFF